MKLKFFLISLLSAALLGVGMAQTKPMNADSIKKQIAARKGKVVLVNFWATWCKPCIAEFPSIVKLHSQYKAKGLEVIAVSVDARSNEKGVNAFMQKQKAPFPSLMFDGKDMDGFINAFDKKWQGDVPRTFIYDKAGKLIKVLEGEQTYQQFETAIKPLLKK